MACLRENFKVPNIVLMICILHSLCIKYLKYLITVILMTQSQELLSF